MDYQAMLGLAAPLAVGLAALVSGMKVRVNTNPSAGDVPVITTIYLVQ